MRVKNTVQVSFLGFFVAKKIVYYRDYKKMI